jgi:site-specific recombinase XerD
VSEFVFLDPKGRPWTGNKVQKRLNGLRRKLHIQERVYAYALRHSFASNALANGHNTATVAELMGHADTTMVSRVYGHIQEQREHLSRSVDEINKRNCLRKSAS